MSGTLYFVALVGALAICVVGGLYAHRPQRRCLRCNKRIDQASLRCRHCGYEFE